MQYVVRFGSLLFLAAACAIGCSAPPSGEGQPDETSEAFSVGTLPTTPTEGWTHTPNYPGETCLFKKVCKWIHAEPPFRTCSGSVVGTDCEIFCDKECLYPVQPKPMPIPDPVIGP